VSDGDEFAWLSENAAEAGLPWSGPPAVRRASVPAEVVGTDEVGGREVSALVWGDGAAQVVLLHGGAQNAHTWDSVALALDRPLVAIDLPGHGLSGWRQDHDYTPAALARDVAVALWRLAPDAQMVVGMSLGGLTALCLAAGEPDLVARLALVDITPSTDATRAEPILAFLSGPERFASFEEILERTIAFNPTRSVSSLRRGVIHNARQLPDGSWSWRWDPSARWRPRPGGWCDDDELVSPSAGFTSLWPLVEGLRVPLLLVRGARSTVVSDADTAELLRRQPHAGVETVADAGHSVQGDQPVALARVLARFLDH
jgi:pimeloyl-ACP methyl ester carboxylesterase